MSTVVYIEGLHFKINPNDHNPPHVHVEGYGANVRINLLTMEAMDDTEFSRASLKKILIVVMRERETLMAKWEEFHGNKKGI